MSSSAPPASGPDRHVLGTPLTAAARRVMLLGSGELGKEVAIELQRLGVEVVAVDRYANAPAMQVAHRSHVIDMLDSAAVKALVELEQPHLIVPEIEAIATAALVDLEADGFSVIPTARATQLTMDREGIRRLAAEELQVPTSPYRFAGSEAEYRAALEAVGLPCVVKPVMSSSGKGQSLVHSPGDAAAAWQYAQQGGRVRSAGADARVIVEGLVPFDYEITLLTVRHAGGTAFCDPVGHRQEDGDYRESWQPQAMNDAVLAECQRVAAAVTAALGGWGLFGVEFFIQGDAVYFSEVSPRPHDTGMVTLISQDLSEFALHVRAILGLPVPNIAVRGPAASAVILARGDSADVRYHGLDAALAQPDTQVRLFGKPEVRGQRRMGVALALDRDVQAARAKARAAAAALTIELG
ncbi:MAG: formate-dependent phosphoribosylglycinamide formyltransferase [Gammaproteobacteria bacterium]|nr:formate-dependent phosphoribosylglycinamide formyltransferase [Gammaproteobacteria bacterium]